MKRKEMLKQLDQDWEILIIGGGATGLGAAVDAASRGFKTLLIEQSDFAKGTSSRSTKLIHGGLRYLQQGNLALVSETLKERGRLCQNAPHLITHRSFFVPSYHWWQGPFYGIGIKIYDLLAGKLGLEPSKHLSRKESIALLPNLEKKGLYGGTLYYDGQFDDSRLALTLAQTAADHGGSVINYMRATGFIKKKGQIVGVKAKDQESGSLFELRSQVVINATGIFIDRLRRLDKRDAPPLIQPSQGVHIILDRSFLKSKTAILIPRTADGRVLFMVPWLNRVLIGTTDTPVKKPALEPKPLKEEIAFILKEASHYLSKPPTQADILACFAGLRPLICDEGNKKTATLSRDHSLFISDSGLITIAGGKWTSYRKMGEDVIDKALLVGGLEERPCCTKTLKLHGYLEGCDPSLPFNTYGSNKRALRALMKETPLLKEKLHPKLPYLKGEVVWHVREEMAGTVEDVLARRTRALLLDARAAIETAPLVAALMAKELKKSKAWEREQIELFTQVARHYLLKYP